MGREADAVAFFARLAEAPHRADFYHTLRQVECLYPDRPRLGRARRPADEGIRLGQDPDLSFAPTPVAALETGGRAPRLLVRLFGLLGPNGPMPIHLTEYARERLRNAGDPTLCRFLDVFNHRFLSFLYQAWAAGRGIGWLLAHLGLATVVWAIVALLCLALVAYAVAFTNRLFEW